MPKRLSKTNLIANIINYVFNTYCDDEQVALYAQDYYELEKKAEERKKQKMSKCHDKRHDKIYKITQQVRDFLEPLVDAEYFKSTQYNHLKDESILFDAMEQLETKQNKKLLKRIRNEK